MAQTPAHILFLSPGKSRIFCVSEPRAPRCRECVYSEARPTALSATSGFALVLLFRMQTPRDSPGVSPPFGGGADTFRYRPPSGELFPKKEFSLLLAKVAIKTKLLGWLKSPSHFFCKMKDTFFSFSPITLLILIF